MDVNKSKYFSSKFEIGKKIIYSMKKSINRVETINTKVLLINE